MIVHRFWIAYRKKAMKTLEFFFGKSCANCKRGWYAKRWTRYDGTGSWRMHERGSITFDNYESFYCDRNGWFSRHRLLTVFILVYSVACAGPLWVAGQSAIDYGTALSQHDGNTP